MLKKHYYALLEQDMNDQNVMIFIRGQDFDTVQLGHCLSRYCSNCVVPLPHSVVCAQLGQGIHSDPANERGGLLACVPRLQGCVVSPCRRDNLRHVRPGQECTSNRSSAPDSVARLAAPPVGQAHPIRPLTDDDRSPCKDIGSNQPPGREMGDVHVGSRSKVVRLWNG